MKVFIRVLLLTLIFTSQSLNAVEVKRLYEAEVVANSESEQDKIVAVRQALEIVLTRILAGDNIQKNVTVKDVLANAMHYISEFQFSLVEGDSQKNNNARLIRVLFNEKLLVDVLRPSKLDFWNEIRTTTLVWLVVEEQGRQRFFDAEVMPEVDAAMSKASWLKRLPVIYPIQDLKEQKNLAVSDVMSAYSEHLIEASQRYDVLSILAGKIVKQETCWKTEWTYYFNSRIEQWRSPCGLINQVALNGIQGIYDRLSKFYSVKSEVKEIDSINLEVSNITDTKELGWLRDYFDSLPMVKTATWVSEDSGYNLYRIFYQGDRLELINSLLKDEVIRAEDVSQLNRGAMKYTLLAE